MMAFKRRLPVLILAVLAMAGGGPALARPYRIVALGDSLTAGYQLPPGDDFASQLEAALRRQGLDVSIVNAGVSGDTTSDGLARLDWSTPEGTDMVILELGANDMLRGIDPATVRDNLATIIAKLQKRGVKVLLAGMLAAPNLGARYDAAFDRIYPDLAKKFGIPLYPFFLDGVASHPALQLPDGMHPNAKGVEVMVKKFLPFARRAVEKDEAKS